MSFGIHNQWTLSIYLSIYLSSPPGQTREGLGGIARIHGFGHFRRYLDGDFGTFAWNLFTNFYAMSIRLVIMIGDLRVFIALRMHHYSSTTPPYIVTLKLLSTQAGSHKHNTNLNQNSFLLKRRDIFLTRPKLSHDQGQRQVVSMSPYRRSSVLQCPVAVSRIKLGIPRQHSHLPQA